MNARSFWLSCGVLFLVIFGGCKEFEESGRPDRVYTLIVGGKEVLLSKTKPTRAKLEHLARNFPNDAAWVFQVWSTNIHSFKPGKASRLLESAKGETLSTLGATVSIVLNDEQLPPTDGGK